MAELPTVSALMAAYNYEQFVGRAIQSALEQDYPAELLEIVVVDDGSTDSTSDIVAELAERHPGRIRHIRQANSGYVAATSRALAEGRGELLALLDADDVWLPHKTRRQVEMLQARPELGMVFSDMVVVDADEQTVRPSLIWHLKEVPERAFARVLYENIATQSSIVIRSWLREHVAPIPPDITYADWWITLRCAQLSRIDFSRDPLALYRVHGSNLTGDVTGAAAVREARKGLAFHFWALRRLALDLTPEEMVYIWDGVEERAERVFKAAGTNFARPVELTEDAGRADELLAEAERLSGEGRVEHAAERTLRALALDPSRVGLRELLQSRAEEARAASNPLADARGLVVLVDAEELLAGDELLLAYASAVEAVPGLTLAIDATRLPAEHAGSQLQELVGRCGLLDRGDIEMVAVVGERPAEERQRMLASADARYGRAAPAFTPENLDELVALARERARPKD